MNSSKSIDLLRQQLKNQFRERLSFGSERVLTENWFKLFQSAVNFFWKISSLIWNLFAVKTVEMVKKRSTWNHCRFCQNHSGRSIAHSVNLCRFARFRIKLQSAAIELLFLSANCRHSFSDHFRALLWILILLVMASWQVRDSDGAVWATRSARSFYFDFSILSQAG